MSEVRGVTNQPTLRESRMGEMCIKYICLEVSRLVCVCVCVCVMWWVMWWVNVNRPLDGESRLSTAARFHRLMRLAWSAF